MEPAIHVGIGECHQVLILMAKRLGKGGRREERWRETL